MARAYNTEIFSETVYPFDAEADTSVTSAPSGLSGAPVIKGDKGDDGDQGPAGNANFFIGPTQPVTTVSPYVWLQTGLPGGGMTIWVEDGT